MIEYEKIRHISFWGPEKSSKTLLSYGWILILYINNLICNYRVALHGQTYGRTDICKVASLLKIAHNMCSLLEHFGRTLR